MANNFTYSIDFLHISTSFMLSKQFGALHLAVLAALLAFSIIAGLGVLFFLDRAMLARTATAAQSQNAGGNRAAAPRATNSGITKILEVSPTNGNNPRADVSDKNLLNEIAKDPARAKAALRSAPAGAIQSAVQAKTGKSVSTENIDEARQKALSPDAQSKLDEILKQRDEILKKGNGVDFSKIRDKLGQ